MHTYTVEIEDGIDTVTWGGDDAFARMVDTTLANPKSWTNDPRFAFRRVDAEQPDFRITLSSQMTTRRVCGFDIPIDTSCNNQGLGRVVLDEARWVRGAVQFDGDVGSYRQYMINHEVGHAIGYQQHQPCENDGALAPIMMHPGADHDATDLRHREQRHRPTRSAGRRPDGREGVPVQSVAVPAGGAAGVTDSG